MHFLHSCYAKLLFVFVSKLNEENHVFFCDEKHLLIEFSAVFKITTLIEVQNHSSIITVSAPLKTE